MTTRYRRLNIRYRLSGLSPERRKMRAQAQQARRDDQAWDGWVRDRRAERADRENTAASEWEREPDAYRSKPPARTPQHPGRTSR